MREANARAPFAMDKLHEEFKERAEGRLAGVDPQVLLTFTVWLEAQQLGMLDDLPNVDDALDAAKLRGGIDATRLYMSQLRQLFTELTRAPEATKEKADE